jgi:spore maturation protein CgeB
MRSFEAASIGGCILAEDTEDHRELFGPDGVAARYFRTIDDLVKIARDLSADREMRARMSDQLRSRMRERRDAYADRLAEMLRLTYLAHC